MLRYMETVNNPFLELEGPQWAFAVDLYRRPGVAAACLLLQDTIGADISLLLFVMFAAEIHRTGLERADLENLDNAIAAWRREVIWPLRAIRRRMKTGPEPAPAAATEALLQQIKVAEIHAEQIELAALAQWFDRHLRTGATAPVDRVAVLERLTAFFAARHDSPQEGQSLEVRAALKTIADALTDQL
jgi:uncharacterized protein (TIGR02444 family)